MAVSAGDLSAPGTVSLTVSDASGAVSNALRFGIASPAAATAGVALLVSAAVDGSGADGDSLFPPSLSATARYIAFQSNATNLVAGPASGFGDIYVRDTCLGAPAGCVPSTVRASMATDGTLANGNSRAPSISGDGRYVSFDSSATNLVANDTWTNGNADIFLRDTCIGAPAGCVPSTVRLSVTPTGTQANGQSRGATIGATGRYVVFGSAATDLTGAPDTNNWPDLFMRDTCLGAPSPCSPATTRVSLSAAGAQADQSSGEQSMTPDGRFVAFESYADNLVPGDNNGQPDIFLRDTCTGAPAGCAPTTTRVSIGNDGSQGNDGSSDQSISADGRFVAFSSLATNLVPADTEPAMASKDVFVRDTCFGAPAGCLPSTVRVSVSAGGKESNGISDFPVISADGHWVAFLSNATNLAPGANGHGLIFLAKTGF